MRILVSTCRPSRDPHLRFNQLGVMGILLQTNQVILDAFKPYAKLIITDIIQPNLVWRVGRVSGTIR